MRLRTIFGCLSLLLWAAPCFAVEGIYINTRNGTGSLEFYGTIDGELWRHDIKDDAVISHKKIYPGPASRPAISPDGKHIAFIKKTGNSTGKVAMVDINGGNEVELADCLRNSLIDFPDPNYIYFTMGGFHESTSGQLKRINLQTKAVETVMQVKGTNGSNTRIAQIQISNDLTKAVLRLGDDESSPAGAIVALNLNSDNKVDQTIGTTYSCGAGFFSDGVHVMDGWTGHNGFDIRNYSDASKVKSFSNADAFNWAPNNGDGDPGDTEHAIFNTGAATNSDRWMCIVTGGSRNYKWDSTLLLNWKDERCIFVTKGLQGPWDHGDFWAGTIDGTNPTDEPPTITQHPIDANVKELQSATFSITAKGSTPLSYQWQRNNANIQGATSSSYTTPPLTLADSGSTYRCIVKNALGTATSDAAKVAVEKNPVQDTTPPTISSVVTSPGVNDKVVVLFSEAVDKSTAVKTANYSIDKGVSIKSAALDATLRNVTLTTSALADGTYTLTVNAVTDLSGNPIASGSKKQFDYASQAVNKAPTVEAGDDQATYVNVKATLVGSVVDDGLPKGSQATSTWSVAEGDAQSATFDDANSPITTVQFSQEGTYKLRLSATDGELEASDELTVTVKSAQAITILSPSGGEKWPMGSTQTIAWETNNVDDVMILITVDGGEKWTTIVQSIDTTSPDWGKLPFTVPNTPTDKARIRIESYIQGQADPPQSGLFSIVDDLGATGPASADDPQMGLDEKMLVGGCQLTSPEGTSCLPLSLLLGFWLFFRKKANHAP